MTALTFEQTYVKYPFAPLVRLALKLCAYFIERNMHDNSGIDLGKTTLRSA